MHDQHDRISSRRPGSVPAWMERAMRTRGSPASGGDPSAAPSRDRRPHAERANSSSRPARTRRAGATAAGAIAVSIALVAGGYLLATVRPGDRGDPSAAEPVEPVARVASSLLPSVVQLETPDGIGSGVVYEARGLIVTAAHVVEGARRLTVRLADGRRVPGRVVGTDADTDVAVVRAERGNLDPARLAANAPLEVGQLAVAIGSPFGLESTVTSGVVSAVGRSVPTEDGATSMIQTDAPINPGNSGGALADRTGRVIGINDAIRSQTGVNAGVGFAIPIDVVIDVADSLISGGSPRTGSLGVSGITPAAGRPGALLTHIEPRSPADDAGLRPGDLVTRFDGVPVTNILDLMAAIRAAPPGGVVDLEIFRAGARRVVDVVVAAR
jgi:putative serine protease PepD